MGPVASVWVNGRALTWTALVRLFGPDVAEVCPVAFDVARELPRAQAEELHAWLRRRRVDAVLLRPRPATSARRVGQSRTHLVEP